jgi:diguanylate cyclase (GGDEF)-like protein
MSYVSPFNLFLRSLLPRKILAVNKRKLAIIVWYFSIGAGVIGSLALKHWPLSCMLFLIVLIPGSATLISWLYYQAQTTQKSLEKRVCELSLLNELSELLQSCKEVKEVQEVVTLVGQALLPGYQIVLTNALKGMPAFEHNGEGYTRYVPLKLQEVELGVMAISTSDDDIPFRASVMALGDIMADYIALALFNIRSRDQLYIQATRDGLTGIYNRRYMQEALYRELAHLSRSGQPLSVLMLDIDYFKQLNDTYGHDYGDTILIKVAQVLASNVRTHDIVARYGGEEFFILLPHTSSSTALARAEALRMAVSEIGYSIGNITLTCSIGVATAIQETTSEALLKRADVALYQAKGAGRNCVKRA